MCGICGFLGHPDPSLLPALMSTIAHRGPDGQGEYHEDLATGHDQGPLHLGLGHCRLSIIDLSEAGRQPMSNEDDTVWITFNGEIYNCLTLRDKLERRGHRFKSRTDTEVILHLYEDKGEECVHDLEGMFAFAIWDRARQKLFMARDRLGIKPLYYIFKDEQLVFASELKALLKYGGCSREMSPEALLYFLTFLYIPSPLSVFKDAHKLPPGHCLIWDRGRVSSYAYWQLHLPAAAASRAREDQGPIEKLVFDRVEETVASHLISDVPIGVFLSGGMDSGAIVGLMKKVTSQPVKTFSIGYGPEATSYNELSYSRLMADHFKTDHHEFILKPDVVRLLPEIVWHMDEPFADSSAIPSYLISQAARKHVKVALSGIGGDELFGGYPRYLGARLASTYGRCPRTLREAMDRLTSCLPESTSSSNLLGRIKRFFRGGTLSQDRCYLGWVSFLSGGEAGALLSPDLRDLLDPMDSQSHHLAQLRRVLAPENPGGQPSDSRYSNDPGDRCGGHDWINALQCLDIATYLPDDLLIMGDKMSMAHGMEVRVPFCDHLLVQDMMTIPSRIKYKRLKLKSLMKSSFRHLLPPEILAHKKQGFMVPIAVWLKNELRGLVEDLLSKERTQKRGYFQYSCIRAILDQHYSGKQNRSDLIYALLVLELWHQLYMD